jgi:hypothetical protein
MAFEPDRLTAYSDGILAIAADFITTAQQAGLSLLSLFAVLDIVLFGIAVALGQRDLLAKGIWKLLLIGAVLLLVRDGGTLIQTLADSALYLARGNRALMPDPVALLAAGTSGGLDLMRLSADSGTQLLGASISLSGLALALVITFGLAAGALLYQLAAFHVTAGVALIMLPIGLFTPGRALLGRAGHGLISATVRLTVVVLISLPMPPLLDAMMVPITRQSALDVPIAQLCLGLCLLVLLLALPRAAIAVIGDFSGVADPQAAQAASAPVGVSPQTTPLPRGALQAAAAVPLALPAPANRAASANAIISAAARLASSVTAATAGATSTTNTGGTEGLRGSLGISHTSAPGVSSGPRTRTGTALPAQMPLTPANLERLVGDALRRSLAADPTTRGYQAIAAGTRTEDDKSERPDDHQP